MLEKAQKFQKKYSSSEMILDDELPKHFDWRNIDGYDFTGQIRDQKACGSCYTVAFTQVAEARLKLKYGEEPPQLSPQFLLQCNYMTEGCEGGWPHFQAYFAQNGHMVSEECAPYTASTKGGECAKFASCKPEARVVKTYDVGGGYGKTTEKLMMKEILRNGPLNTEFQAPSIFSMYKSGLLTQDGFASLKEMSDNEGINEKANNLSNKTLNDHGFSWANVNHSVMIMGWGEDPNNGTRYWIVRNSYGKSWGDKGDFLVRRGQDDMGIESEQVAFEVERL